MCNISFPSIFYDTSRVALIHVFRETPPYGAAHVDDHVVKRASVPLPAHRLGSGAQWFTRLHQDESAHVDN